MSLTPEQQKELARFPTVLRALIEAELAAGNAIDEIGHSFPAPPAGACFKLAKQVSVRPRASGDGLDFRERNSSTQSGEFTDAQRFYFILEPPVEAPPPPDMDAIRKALEPRPDPQVQFAQTRKAGARSVPETERAPARTRAQERKVPTPASDGLSRTETETGTTWWLHFRDHRPPEEVQFTLERAVMTLCTSAMDQGKLCLRAKANVNGARYTFELQFEAALPGINAYSLRVTGSWAEHQATNHEYFRTTSESWFQLWTREWTAASSPREGEGWEELYRSRSDAALKAEAHLDSVAAIQQAILTGLKRGGRYSQSHKEGGTNITWRNGRFVRADYGEYPADAQYTDEAEFLGKLRQFCHLDVTRSAGREPLSDLDTWRLILRRLQPGT